MLKTLVRTIVIACCLASPSVGWAKNIDEYLPILQSTLDGAIPIDNQKGYGLIKVKPNVYVMTDGIWQSAFVTTGKGVVVLDAPESFGAKIIPAIRSVTDEPIKILVYSHAHKDHISGSVHFKDVPKLQIVAEDSVTKFLKEKNDPNRLIPTVSFKDEHTIKLGTENIELKKKNNFHSNESDIFVYMPEKKFLMVIDSVTPGYVTFKGLDLTTNVHEYLKMFDSILNYDFDVFVGGHLGNLGDRSDVEIAKEYTLDLYNTVKRVHAETDMNVIMGNAAKKIGWNNKFLLFKIFLDEVARKSSEEIIARWKDRLSSVDVWAESHADTMLTYIRWDD